MAHLFFPPSTTGWLFRIRVPLALAAITFLVYLPSLRSDFVYDARKEILEEGFITSPGYLPDVLTFKVLGSNLMLGSRPGQLLYLMLIAAVCGTNPLGYHLCSNLLHAANVALLYVLLQGLLRTKAGTLPRGGTWSHETALAVAALVFALHPLAAEPVSAIGYSSDLLVTFFTLAALLFATEFRAENSRSAWIVGSLGALCAFASVTCKESGVATALALIVYWLLFRRRDARLPWILFLGAATAVTALFLAARFRFAMPAAVSPDYVGGSLGEAIVTQPQIWAFMMGKIFWPVNLSADYTMENVDALWPFFAWVIFIVVVLMQIRLARRSRLGALGVAVYWLGLVAVSNFVPLNRIVADRFYYLPLAGFSMQLLAVFVMVLKMRRGFWFTVAPVALALVPLTALTVIREGVFANEGALWADTLRVSPFSWTAQNGAGLALLQKGQVHESIPYFMEALQLNPSLEEAHNNLGNALSKEGRYDEALRHYAWALKIDPGFAEAGVNLGNALLQKGESDMAIAQYQMTIAQNPFFAAAHYDLGNAFLQKSQYDDAIAEFQKAVTLNPHLAEARYNLGIAYGRKGDTEKAAAQFREVLRLNPNDAEAQKNLEQAEGLQSQ